MAWNLEAVKALDERMLEAIVRDVGPEFIEQRPNDIRYLYREDVLKVVRPLFANTQYKTERWSEARCPETPETEEHRAKRPKHNTHQTDGELRTVTSTITNSTSSNDNPGTSHRASHSSFIKHDFHSTPILRQRFQTQERSFSEFFFSMKNPSPRCF
ncbi:hypothetical protein AUP68_11369 [Ilyonectria robusta]